ncbi:MAG: tetratricopeptide repeat protein, partial [Leptospiraceae bacterium]|nr:tetratricopeptide repeat protein [Leptospiraceae bacterium]
LYRNGKAEFIEDTLSFRKLGTPGVQGNIFIRALQMEPGDVLIAGSDGRDDIRMENPDGTTTVSDDEFAFLAHVETGDGLLEPIVESLKKQGELTDDLSLIRVAYREDAPAEVEADQMPFNMRQHYRAAQEDVKNGLYIQAIKNLSKALNINPHSRRVLRMLALAYVQLKQYDEAIRYGNEYLSVRPGDTDFIYLLAYCHKKLGHLDKAADYGERVRLRDPLHLKNLVNLVDVYIARENFTRAGHLLEAALEQDPENAAARRLREKLEARTGNI